jgi:hypothetical protein
MLRDVSQSLVKFKGRVAKREGTAPPKWLAPFVDDGVLDAADNCDPDHIFKYDEDEKKAYRFKPGKEDKKEYCQSMDKGMDTDEMVATWADGKTWAIPGLSSASYAASLTGRAIK